MSQRQDVPVIRPLAPEDREAWNPLWQGYLTFYRATLDPEITETTWSRLLDPKEPVHGLVAVLDGEVVGMVHYLFHRSTWARQGYCYLEDLFTSEAARGRGVGRALIEAVYERARAAGASRVYWHTHEANATARALYDKVAALSGFLQYRKVF
ncbi:GNAT family N-acetyltransferase [Microvirga thermotolerans]|uniref:GNAT family N-acetyltransferase n=1 Tax=Microvirga thermotolerans TaxID=2651334 RepID=A0A5P9JVR6_9HYPH|nr:GNAT family N-acetyltransferase [Microvirga thermotolerans]QFU16523.1 GNAT family N-acetyltransferase [Microvirga thermotolerans]